MGKRLGSAATAVYWHVGSKANLAPPQEIAAGFPRLRELVRTAAAEYGAAPEETFEFGLQAILDGLRGRLDLGGEGT